MSSFATVDPATGKNLKSYDHITWSRAEALVQEAQRDFQIWRRTTFLDRSKALTQLAESLRMYKSKLAQQMQQEMGKLLSEGEAEVEKCAVTCEYFAREAAGMLTPQKAASPYQDAEVSFQPLGVIFSIMPWNFPLWQVLRFAAPALMAGNVVVLKHADQTAGTAELIAQIFLELKSSTNGVVLLRNCQADHEVAEKIIAHPMVRGVTFTGSTAGGRAVAVAAAKNLKKIVLELGGSDAYIILEDADLAMAAKACVQTRTQNCGQSCVAGKRFIVVEKVAQEFVQKYIEEMKKVSLAPLAAKRFQQQIHEQVQYLQSLGGKLLFGGDLTREAQQGASAFFPATVILFEKDHPDIHKIEVFGPVAVIVVARDVTHAFEIANSSPFGLGGGLFTRDVLRGKELLQNDMEAGFVVVNDFVKSDPRIPFGGVKESGYGRELGHFGIMEFVNIKTTGVGGVNL